MRSSTSSSSGAVREGGRVPVEDPRRVALRTAVAGLLTLIAGLAFMRCHIALLDPVMPEKQRLREAVAALPQVAAAPGDAVIVFGSSLVWNGFKPLVFDDRLRETGVEVTTWNFGFGGLNPSRSSDSCIDWNLAFRYGSMATRTSRAVSSGCRCLDARLR